MKFLIISSFLPSVLNFRGKLLEAIHQQGYEIHIIAPDLSSFPDEYQKLLEKHHINCSMTQNSDPYENAVAERVNGILKEEFGLHEIFENYQNLNKQVTQAITLYNNFRIHMSINMITPNQAHQQKIIHLKQWKKINRSRINSATI